MATDLLSLQFREVLPWLWVGIAVVALVLAKMAEKKYGLPNIKKNYEHA